MLDGGQECDPRLSDADHPRHQRMPQSAGRPRLQDQGLWEQGEQRAWEAMVSLTISRGWWRKVYRKTTPEAREASAVPTSAKA